VEESILSGQKNEAAVVKLFNVFLVG